MDTVNNLLQSTVFQTVISGTLVFILGQIIKVFILEPIKEFKGVIGKIDYELKYHANVITNGGLPNEITLESLKAMRKLSCNLESVYKQIPFKTILSWCKAIPSIKALSDAAKNLIRLSNAGGNTNYIDNNLNNLQQIRIALDILEL